jgi:serine/threonine protein kinase/Flp pilus assembly protein TadD
MTPHDETADGTESIESRDFARPARLDRGDDESTVPYPSTPSFGPIGGADAGGADQSPAPSWDDVARAIELEAGPGPNETQRFTVPRGRKRTVPAGESVTWNEWRPAPPEDLLRRRPADPATDPDATSLLAAAYLQRRRGGEDASWEEGQGRPEPSRTLGALVSRYDPFRSPRTDGSSQGATLRLPDVGDEVFGFRLKHPLGKGAFATVFLAGQGHLAGRPVVLKVSAIEGTEPQTLAQLQHTNIVPIYSVHEDPRAGLRAVCMPYFGGASLSAVLKELFAAGPVPRHGRELVRALEAVQAPPPDQAASPDRAVTAMVGQTPLAALAGLDYIRATIGMAARLAEGLQHAHQRGVLHRDIKPANILISAEGQPLLLDFNLAHDQNAGSAQESVGGTIAYMAPEHLRAILGRSPGQARRVDHRSDIYSLGMVIAEMLTGHNPFEHQASYSAFPIQIEAMAVDRSKQAPSMRQARPDVPWGLESVLRKCLDPEPARRYQQAEHLAEDLRRLLDDRPLGFAPELSLAERGRKWARRHPRLTTAGTVAAVAAVALVALATAFAGVSRHLESTRDRLGRLQARDRLAAHDAGTTEALTLVNTVIQRADLLGRGLAVCERTLALYDPPPGSARGEHPDWWRLGLEERRRVAEDRRELFLLAAGAGVLLAPGDRRALHEALARLDRAEAIPGLEPSRALWNDRARYLALLGEAAGARAAQRRADFTPAHTARDHYLLATSHARRGGPGSSHRAIAELNQALRINPRHYWSLILRGICFLERGDSVAASGDFGRCAGLRPDLPWGYFNRGYVLDRSGRKAEAIEDYTAAIERDLEFIPARINRGMALLQLKRYPEALADFQGARDRRGGEDDATLCAGCGMALEGLGRYGEADAEFARAFAASERPAPGAERARLLWTYGFAVSARLPSRARAAFQEVLLGDPRHPQALYGMAMLSMSEDHLEEAIGFFNRAVQAAPDFVEARRYRAIALARSSAWEPASRDIHWCLEREPGSGETLYAAACVSALAAGKLGTAETAQQSLGLLQRALDQGVGLDRFAADLDLKALHTHPEFERLLVRDRAAGARPTGP